ncbi:MAG: hypothetical protein Q9167_000278 [Letrouitia subvulpina]
MMWSSEIPSVARFITALNQLLAKAETIKPDGLIEPALTSSSFDGQVEAIGKEGEGTTIANPQAHYAALETACRNIFYDRLGSTTIDQPSFGLIWNLLDIVSILSDLERCEPGLIFWLVEELLDSQTIAGCKIVFDYLDSRREQITRKHFKQKQLIILRACNELLRRLSRIEDTVFCGRVYIFMFQSFPLGDRSSVNLRGEYHVENVTIFDKHPVRADERFSANMEIEQPFDEANSKDNIIQDDVRANKTNILVEGTGENKLESSKFASNQVESANEPTKVDGDDKKSQAVELDNDTLYPIFWSLQEYFSQPTRLFDEVAFQKFKSGLELTLRKFKVVQEEQQLRGVPKIAYENKDTVKLKGNSTEEAIANSFNPRYLTSRHLFELEISDLAFRRHILVQALIVIDFLLGLTPKAKKKLENASNKSVLYSFTLDDEGAKWATAMRAEIASYLQQGPEGKFYYRMVDTVLSRDKNWVQWKAEGCPPIGRDTLSVEDFEESKKGARKAFAPRRLRATPMGTLDLSFLTETGDHDRLEKLNQPERSSIPTIESFKGPLAQDDFNLEMAIAEEEKEELRMAKESKNWRVLRIAAQTRMKDLDKIEDPNNLQVLFDPIDDENQHRTDAAAIDSGVAKEPTPAENAE